MLSATRGALQQPRYLFQSDKSGTPVSKGTPTNSGTTTPTSGGGLKHKMGASVLPSGFLPPGAGLSAAMGAEMNASLANSIFHGSAGMAAFGRNPMVAV